MVRNFDSLMEQYLVDVHVPQILAEIVGEPGGDEPVPQVLLQERGAASQDTEPVRHSPSKMKAKRNKAAGAGAAKGDEDVILAGAMRQAAEQLEEQRRSMMRLWRKEPDTCLDGHSFPPPVGGINERSHTYCGSSVAGLPVLWCPVCFFVLCSNCSRTRGTAPTARSAVQMLGT